MDANFLRDYLFFDNKEYQNFVKENKNYVLNFELSFFNDHDDIAPAKIFYYDYNDLSTCLTRLAGHTIIKEFKKIELALVGIDNDETNNTCYIITTIKVD
jgi:hypothetical protein